MYDQDLENHVLKGKKSNRWNFDLLPLIKDFDLFDFCRAGINCPAELDFGGILVITDKQYIIGYNAGLGLGSHIEICARVQKDLMGGGEIESLQEGLNLSMQLNQNNLVGRLTYGPSVNKFGRVRYTGFLQFELLGRDGTNRPITKKQYENLIKFCDDYNAELELISRNYRFFVDFTYYDKDGNFKRNTSDNLDNLINTINELVPIVDSIPNPQEVILLPEHNKVLENKRSS